MHRDFAEQAVELLLQVARHPPDLPGPGWKGLIRDAPARRGGGSFRALILRLHAAHQYFRGRATPAGDGKLYSTTSTPLAVNLANHVSPPSPSSSSKPRSRRYASSRRTVLSDSDSLISASTRQIICSDTAIGRPASTTRSIRQRASSRFFCSRSIPSGIQPFLYLCDFFTHLFAHRVQLGVERTAEPDPVLAPHILQRQIHPQVDQLLLEQVNVAGLALMLFRAPLQQELNRARVDRDERDKHRRPSGHVAPV